MKPLCDLGTQQRQILNVLWDRGPSTVRWVREEVGPTLAYTSILSVLQKLERLGWVRHRRSGRAYLYEVTTSKARAQAAALTAFRERVFPEATPLPRSLKAQVQQRQARAA